MRGRERGERESARELRREREQVLRVLVVERGARAFCAAVSGCFTFDGGTILFPLAYIFGDVLTEVYGYARARRVIWTGFVWIAVAAGVFALIDALPAAVAAITSSTGTDGNLPA